MKLRNCLLGQPAFWWDNHMHICDLTQTLNSIQSDLCSTFRRVENHSCTVLVGQIRSFSIKNFQDRRSALLAPTPHKRLAELSKPAVFLAKPDFEFAPWLPTSTHLFFQDEGTVMHPLSSDYPHPPANCNRNHNIHGFMLH